MIYYSTINKNQREKKSNINLKISIFTQIEIKKDIENLKSVYFANGWFNPDIYYEIDTSLFKKKRAMIASMNVTRG